MPVYEYQCAACSHEFEEWQKIKDPPVKTCPKCGKDEVQRLISQTAFQLKGGGWYKDLYSSAGKSSDKSGDKSGSNGKAEAKSESKSGSTSESSKSESKSETKSETKSESKSTPASKGPTGSSGGGSTPAK